MLSEPGFKPVISPPNMSATAFTHELVNTLERDVIDAFSINSWEFSWLSFLNCNILLRKMDF